jgi:hypothetical protein
MYDAGVVTGLVDGDPVLLVQDDYTGARPSLRDLAANRQSENARSNDSDDLVRHG